ncbi:DMT family transporter [Novosphingobium sp. PP1Y]|uniref:DMT family transporter n=1 Tax=Novosphingobium sp. PP1Y TaxID=702113 RepID=UPI00020EEC56|nr:DMT family transporter [Novosphingobium sp. PP1Y]CCA92479.1 conserved hypothetical protein [Novosphingobium sp. PP1Y]
MDADNGSPGFRQALRYVWGSPFLLLSLASLFWALNPIVGRAARDLLSPLSLAFWRWLVALLVLLPFAWRHVVADRKVLCQAWPMLTVLGVFGVGVFAYIGYWSLQLTTATNNLLLQSTMPIMTLVMPSILFGERIRPLLVASAALSFSGVTWIVTRGQPLALDLGGLNHGDLLALLGVFLYSAYATFLRKVPAIHHITLLAVLFAVGMATLALPYLASLAKSGITMPRIEVIGAVLYVGIFPSLVAYALFNRAVALIGSVRAGVYMNLPTVFGVFLAVLLLGERLETYHMVGAAIVVAAIFVSRWAASGQTENKGERKP